MIIIENPTFSFPRMRFLSLKTDKASLTISWSDDEDDKRWTGERAIILVDFPGDQESAWDWFMTPADALAVAMNCLKIGPEAAANFRSEI